MDGAYGDSAVMVVVGGGGGIISFQNWLGLYTDGVLHLKIFNLVLKTRADIR